MPGGDVRFDLRTEGLPETTDLGGLLRESMGCQWTRQIRPIAQADVNFVNGFCRHFLNGAAPHWEGSFNLAPVVKALRKEGASEVQVYLGFHKMINRAVPPASGWQRTEDAGDVNPYFHFRSADISQVPPPFRMVLDEAADDVRYHMIPHPLDLPNLLRSVLLMLAAALAAAYGLRRRGQQGAAGSALALGRWLFLGIWLYWIWAVKLYEIADFASGLRLPSLLLNLLVGAALFSFPPVLATIGGITVLAPVLGTNGFAAELRRVMAGPSVWAFACGVFASGYRLEEYSTWVWMVSLALGLGLIFGLPRVLERKNRSRFRRLDRGAFRERAMELAGSAGVPLRGVLLRRSNGPQEANLSALPGPHIAITDGLLERLTQREADAALAHEIGHLLLKHAVTKTVLGVVSTIGVLLFIPHFQFGAGGDVWGDALVLAILASFLVASQVSQRHELAADAAGAELTQDAEGLMAALSRLSQVNQWPREWGSVEGALASHPSPRKRVLALARRFGIAEMRALEILQDPDVLAGEDAVTRYSHGEELRRPDPVLDVTNISAHGLRGLRLQKLTAFVLCLALYYVAYAWGNSAWHRVVYLLGLPLVLWAYLRFDDILDRRFLQGVERKILPGLPGGSAGQFVGLRPDSLFTRQHSMFAWDLGRLFLTSERLVYIGERARFVVVREGVTECTSVKSPLSWQPRHAVAIRWRGGEFSLEPGVDARSQETACELQAQLEAWRGGEFAPDEFAEEFAELEEPDLPAPTVKTEADWKMGLTILMRCAGLLIQTTLAMMVLDIARVQIWAKPQGIKIASMVTTPVPLAVPLIYLISCLPLFFSWKGKGEGVGQPARARGVPVGLE
jgi:Zn-dependent protease with chaperone function